MPATLTHEQARRVYDRIGRLQDTQAWYEDRAVDALIGSAALEQAHAVVEFGCGTGRHAARLLATRLPADATYLGVDVSPRMVALAGARLRRFGARARVQLTDGAPRLPAADGAADRVLSTYVVDLLADADVRALLAEAHRVLRDDGKLCLVSAAPGETMTERVVMRLVGWFGLIGGCRPTDVRPYLDGPEWRVDELRTVSVLGISSQLVVASKVPRG